MIIRIERPGGPDVDLHVATGDDAPDVTMLRGDLDGARLVVLTDAEALADDRFSAILT